MSQQVRNAYALVRPPGHHAESDKGMGYCVFGNVAITAMYAKKKYNLKRIAVVSALQLKYTHGIDSRV